MCCECFFTSRVIHFHGLLQLQLQSPHFSLHVILQLPQHQLFKNLVFLAKNCPNYRILFNSLSVQERLKHAQANQKIQMQDVFAMRICFFYKLLLRYYFTFFPFSKIYTIKTKIQFSLNKGKTR